MRLPAGHLRCRRPLEEKMRSAPRNGGAPTCTPAPVRAALTWRRACRPCAGSDVCTADGSGAALGKKPGRAGTAAYRIAARPSPGRAGRGRRQAAWRRRGRWTFGVCARARRLQVFVIARFRRAHSWCRAALPRQHPPLPVRRPPPAWASSHAAMSSAVRCWTAPCGPGARVLAACRVLPAPSLLLPADRSSLPGPLFSWPAAPCSSTSPRGFSSFLLDSAAPCPPTLFVLASVRATAASAAIDLLQHISALPTCHIFISFLLPP